MHRSVAACFYTQHKEGTQQKFVNLLICSAAVSWPGWGGSAVAAGCHALVVAVTLKEKDTAAMYFFLLLDPLIAF